MNLPFCRYASVTPPDRYQLFFRFLRFLRDKTMNADIKSLLPESWPIA